MTHRITIENEQTAVVLPRGYKTMIRRAATLALAAGSFENRAEIDVTLVEANEIQRLNRDFRKTDRPTDVLSFPLLEDVFHPAPEDYSGRAIALGDVIICPAVLACQAKERGITLQEELCRMAAHSVLHLIGMDHADPKEEKRMFALQEGVVNAIKKEFVSI